MVTAAELLEDVGHQRADDGDGVLVLTDLGSGVMSAETALDLVNPAVRGRVRVSCAPLVEGFVSAYAAAGIGRTLNTVAEEAERALEFKDTQMVR